MKVLHINTTDRGGAAKALTRLHEGLLEQSIDSKVLTLYHETSSYAKKIYPFHNGHHSILDKAKYSVLYRIDDLKKKKILKNKNKSYEVFSFPFTIYNLHKHPLVKEADIIHLHWVGDFLDYSSFFEKINKPIVWTLHDLNPFSGGFHYSEDSIENQLAFQDLEKEYLHIKEKAVKNQENLHIVCLSKWIENISKKSSIFQNFPHHLIPNGLNLKVFKEYDNTITRKKLNLPLDEKIILFVADNINNHRKGFKYLKQALKELELDNFICILVGSYQEKTEEDYFLHFDFVKDDSMLAQIYTCTDAYIIPSLEDNLPNTVLESLACGTPVIGFDVGGVPDMIQNGKNGYLVTPRNSQELAQKITLILKDDNLRKNMSNCSRRIAEGKYSIERQSQKYIDLYNNVLEKKL